MRSLLLAIALFVLGSTATAADIVCACADKKCSDVRINFLDSNPGVYLSIEFAYGEKNKEGFADITRDSKDGSTLYALGNFLVLEKNNVYTLPNKPQVCN